MPLETVTFEHFEIARREDGSLHELGRGAMGVTYKALDTRLGSHVALKVINADYLNNEVARERFLREARAAAHLNHPNVAAIFHRGQDGGTFFYAMQFIEGETVDGFVKRRGSLDAALALRLILQASQGLAAANERGLIHRDIKPANLMLVHNGSQDDEDLLVKIIDFGLAKTLHTEAGTLDLSLTGGGPIGTPHYMSPEQIDPSSGEIDARTDIYSLGVTLWYLLAGQPPFLGSQFQVFNQHMHKPPPLEKLSSSVPAPVGALLARMLAKDPAERPASHRELVGEIKTILRDPAVLNASAAGADESDAYAPLPTAFDDTSGGDATLMDDGDPPTANVRIEDATLADDFETSLPMPPPIVPSAVSATDFSLIEVLRCRGKLPIGEALLILDALTPLAAASQLMPGGPGALQFDVIRVIFSITPPNLLELPAIPITGWPAWELEFIEPPVNPADELGEMTMAPRPAGGGAKEAPRALAALFYELLKGAPPALSDNGSGSHTPPPPLPALNESGNAVLRRALANAGRPFGSAREFRDEMVKVVKGGPATAAVKSSAATTATAATTAATGTPAASASAMGALRARPAAPAIAPAAASAAPGVAASTPAPTRGPIPTPIPTPTPKSKPSDEAAQRPSSPALPKQAVYAVIAVVGTALLAFLGWEIMHNDHPDGPGKTVTSPTPSRPNSPMRPSAGPTPIDTPEPNPILKSLELSSPSPTPRANPPALANASTPNPSRIAAVARLGQKTAATPAAAPSSGNSPNSTSIYDSLQLASPKPSKTAAPTPKLKLPPQSELPANSVPSPAAGSNSNPMQPSQITLPSVHTYQGNVGGMNTEYSLQWGDGGSVNGNYSYPGSSNKTVYQLKGTNNGNGYLEMKEYTAGKVTATLKLNKALSNGEVVWSGKMYNTDGKNFSVVMKRKQDGSGN